MHAPTVLSFSAFLSTALAATIPLSSRQNNACFITGTNTLPGEVSDAVNALAPIITCSSTVKTLSSVPDVSSNGLSFSSINFADSGSSPLAFALSEFATATPLASTSLATFQDRLNVYVATEAGIRSVGGNLDIKVPKFFLSFQIARIKTAQGTVITDPGQTVSHLLGKVQKNASSKDKALLGQVEALATTLA